MPWPSAESELDDSLDVGMRRLSVCVCRGVSICAIGRRYETVRVVKRFFEQKLEAFLLALGFVLFSGAPLVSLLPPLPPPPQNILHRLSGPKASAPSIGKAVSCFSERCTPVVVRCSSCSSSITSLFNSFSGRVRQ